jgi:hypothetical protein
VNINSCIASLVLSVDGGKNCLSLSGISHKHLSTKKFKIAKPRYKQRNPHKSHYPVSIFLQRPSNKPQAKASTQHIRAKSGGKRLGHYHLFLNKKTVTSKKIAIALKCNKIQGKTD